MEAAWTIRKTRVAYELAEHPAPKDSPHGENKTTAAQVKRKRKRDQDRNEFLPDRSRDELEEQSVGSLEFNEVLDEEVRAASMSVS